MSNIIYAIPFFICLIFIEFTYGYFKKRNTYTDKKDTLISLGLGLGQLGLIIAVSGIMLSLNYFLYQYRLFNLGDSWYEIALLFILMDISFYWWHRASHKVRFLWANHVNHHSSKEYNFSTALRQPIFSPMLRPFFYLYIPILGFDPILIYSVGVFSLIWAVFYHTKHIKKLGILEWVLVTPSHHRVHHGINGEYLDKNYGAVFIVWDMIFGTFQPEERTVKFGITNNINTYNPIKVIFHEWRSWLRDLALSRSLKDVFKNTFHPPRL